MSYPSTSSGTGYSSYRAPHSGDTYDRYRHYSSGAPYKTTGQTSTTRTYYRSKSEIQSRGNSTSTYVNSREVTPYNNDNSPSYYDNSQPPYNNASVNLYNGNTDASYSNNSAMYSSSNGPGFSIRRRHYSESLLSPTEQHGRNFHSNGGIHDSHNSMDMSSEIMLSPNSHSATDVYGFPCNPGRVASQNGEVIKTEVVSPPGASLSLYRVLDDNVQVDSTTHNITFEGKNVSFISFIYIFYSFIKAATFIRYCIGILLGNPQNFFLYKNTV